MAKLGLKPEAKDGRYYYGTFPETSLMALAGYVKYFVAIVKEKEGITAVFSEDIRENMGLYSQKKIEGPFCLITFEAKTSLGAVGITAAASSALAKEKIPANMVAGYFHDHVLVPFEKKDAAIACLAKL
ncbi:MAG: ACT domain-containing protein [Candidatus Micrarchaeia archaeon]